MARYILRDEMVTNEEMVFDSKEDMLDVVREVCEKNGWDSELTIYNLEYYIEEQAR